MVFSGEGRSKSRTLRRLPRSGRACQKFFRASVVAGRGKSMSMQTAYSRLPPGDHRASAAFFWSAPRAVRRLADDATFLPSLAHGCLVRPGQPGFLREASARPRSAARHASGNITPSALCMRAYGADLFDAQSGIGAGVRQRRRRSHAGFVARSTTRRIFRSHTTSLGDGAPTSLRRSRGHPSAA
jgi:hypothetical protein